MASIFLFPCKAGSRGNLPYDILLFVWPGGWRLGASALALWPPILRHTVSSSPGVFPRSPTPQPPSCLLARSSCVAGLCVDARSSPCTSCLLPAWQSVLWRGVPQQPQRCGHLVGSQGSGSATGLRHDGHKEVTLRRTKPFLYFMSLQRNQNSQRLFSGHGFFKRFHF